jgi:hypothetical protein
MKEGVAPVEGGEEMVKSSAGIVKTCQEVDAVADGIASRADASCLAMGSRADSHGSTATAATPARAKAARRAGRRKQSRDKVTITESSSA